MNYIIGTLTGEGTYAIHQERFRDKETPKDGIKLFETISDFENKEQEN